MAQELATQPLPLSNTDPTMHFTGPTAAINPSTNCSPCIRGIDGGGEAIMSSMPTSVIARMTPVLPPAQRQPPHHVAGGREPLSPLTPSSNSCSSSASSSDPSSPGAAETDGQDGDDEGEFDVRVKSSNCVS